jgi:hypothetical protein
MKLMQGIKLAPMLFAAGLFCTGCTEKESITPPPTVVTNAPVAPVVVPTTPAPAVVAPTNVPVATTNPVSAEVLSPQQAKDHVGDEATVRGQVFGVHITAKGDAFINVGAAYPNQPFTAVCFQGAIPAEDLKKLDGKTISFKGKIKDHNGQPEIILDSADQISE